LLGSHSIPNVNVWIADTEYGTSTNSKGDYYLPVFTQKLEINLRITSIGYQDTIILINLRQTTNDSIQVDVKLKEEYYRLDEVVVVAKSHFFNKEGYNISDIEFLENEVVILVSNSKASKYFIVDFNTNVLHEQELTEKYTEIYKDCFGNLELVSKETCIQFLYNNHDTSIYTLGQFPYFDFEQKLKPCLYDHYDHLLFESTVENEGDYIVDQFHHKKADFFYVDKQDPEKRQVQLVSFFDNEAYLVAQSIYQEIIARYNLTTPVNENIFEVGIWDGNILRLLNNDPELFNLISWYQNIESRPIQVDVFRQNNMLLFFDFVNYRILKYGQKMELIDTISVQKFKNNYNRLECLIQDKQTEYIYGISKKGGFYQVHLINMANGSISPPQYSMPVRFAELISIHRNSIFAAYYDHQKKEGIIKVKRLSK